MIHDDHKIYSGTLQPVLDELIERPIAPQRWHACQSHFVRALDERAKDRKTNREYELQAAARQAISLTVSGLSIPARLYDLYDFTRVQLFVKEAVRAKINNWVTEDLLGLGWREIAIETSEEETESYEAQWLAEIELQTILQVSQDDDMEMLIGRYLGETWAETANRLGKTEPALWKQWERFRTRIKKM